MVGSTFIPIILGSDKTMVSVATSNNEYYLLYMSVSNVHNSLWQAHQDVLILIGFLAIPKSLYCCSLLWCHLLIHCSHLAKREHSSNVAFCNFCRQLFHSSLVTILQSLKPTMTTPEVVWYADGHFWCTVYRLRPYIADYEEQVLLTCIVCHWCLQ